MNIYYYGHSCFKIEAKKESREAVGKETVTILIDPFDERVGLKPPKGDFDLVLTSHKHHDHSAIKNLNPGFFLIDGPGEYTYKGIDVHGIATFHDDKNGTERGENTIYLLTAEGVHLLFLGDLGHGLSEELIEEIGAVNVLFVPVGDGKYTLDLNGVKELIKEIDPSIVVPMHYAMEGSKVEDLGTVEAFFHALGVPQPEPQPKLVVRANQFSEEETAFAILKP